MKLQIFFSVVVILLAYSHANTLAQEGRSGGCPVISVSQLEADSTGPKLIYKANVQGGDSLVTPKFNWIVSAGKITGASLRISVISA